MKRFLPLILFASCSGGKEPDQSTNPAVALQVEMADHYSMLSGTWMDLRDSAHVVGLSDSVWTDIYSGDTVSVSPFLLYSKSPKEGGSPAKDGKTLWLEESPGNFYEFEIRRLDTFALEIRHIQADRLYEFERQR